MGRLLVRRTCGIRGCELRGSSVKVVAFPCFSYGVVEVFGDPGASGVGYEDVVAFDAFAI